MRKIVVFIHTGYCGEDTVQLEEVSDDETDEELHELAWEMAVDHASSYGHELCSDECEDDECEYEHPGMTNIEGYWEDYVPDKHDGLIPTY